MNMGEFRVNITDNHEYTIDRKPKDKKIDIYLPSRRDSEMKELAQIITEFKKKGALEHYLKSS